MRQPIVAVLGHVDHGKTSLLDKIRQTAVADKEAGGITQEIGTTQVPRHTIEKISGKLLKKFSIDVKIPGLLFIDTPGHAAFSTLRKRGGSIADIAILVVDIFDGIMPQTEESIQILKQSKTPFVIAVNKIDRIQGWLSDDPSFLSNIERQSDSVKAMFEQKFYEMYEKLASYGIDFDRFDRISDFTKKIAAIPLSAKTSEGLPELVAVLTALSQQYLKDQLEVGDKSEGIILEVKEVTGLGTTIDAIIYNGIVRKNDFLIIGGSEPRMTKIRALLEPDELKDIRREKKFRNIEYASAASGIKIAAPGLEGVVAGCIIRTARTEDEGRQRLEELKEMRESVELKTNDEGIILKANTVGGIEALISIFENYPIRQTSIGSLTKEDIIDAEANKLFENRAIIMFNMKPSEELSMLAYDKSVKLLSSEVIYRLIEDYEKWTSEEKDRLKETEIESITLPGKVTLLKGCIFRASNPAIVGCEVLSGKIKSEYSIEVRDRVIGTVKQIQSEGKPVDSAKKGDKIALSIKGPTIGRQIKEGDLLYVAVPERDYKKLLGNLSLLDEDSKQLLEEYLNIKRKSNPRWGM